MLRRATFGAYYFLDFETFQQAIPPFDGARPYQQIPSQYSLHVLRAPDAELKHYEFLAEAGTDPRRSVAVSVKSSASSRFKGALCTISVDFLLLSVQSDCREKPGLVAGANSSAFFFCSELLERYHQLTLLFLSIDIPPKSFSGKSWEFPWKVSGVYRECIRSCIKCTLE